MYGSPSSLQALGGNLRCRSFVIVSITDVSAVATTGGTWVVSL